MVELNVATILSKKGSEQHAVRVQDFLLGLGHTVWMEKETAERIGEKGVDLSTSGADFLITVGGDGTILRALQLADLPIFGINSGGRGFLTERDLTNFGDGLKKVFRGEATIEERNKISCSIPGVPDATNEIFLHRKRKPIRFRISIDGELIREERGDGAMVVTPTGSTSYSLGLGGPVLGPGVDAFLVNFAAPFDYSIRTIVVPASATIELELIEGEGALDSDGQRSVEVEEAKVELKKSQKRARFVRLGGSFYQRMREKL